MVLKQKAILMAGDESTALPSRLCDSLTARKLGRYFRLQFLTCEMLLFSSLPRVVQAGVFHTQKALREGSARGWDLPRTAGLQPTLILRSLGQSQTYLAWNPPAVWQSGGLTLGSAAAINGTKHTLRALCRAKTRALDIRHEESKYLPQI